MMPNESADIGHYWGILKNRKNFFLIPALVVLVVISLFAFLWPPTFESSSTILIEDQQIPPEFVRSTVTGFADQRIQSLTQQILSRVKLWEIVQQFNLYSKQREKLTREEILEQMRNDIKLTTISAEVAESAKRKQRSSQSQVTIAFSVAYRGENPKKVQEVTGTLASLYLEQNLKNREAQAQSTTKFLEAELKGLQERIQELGHKITAFKEQHDGLLPEQHNFNQSQVARLEMENKQLENNIRTAEERKSYLEGQLVAISPDASYSSVGGQRVMSPAERLKMLEVSLADLQSKFSPDHPDVRKVKREIAELKKLTGTTSGSLVARRKRLAQLKNELAEKQGKYSDQHPEIKKLKNEIAQLEQLPDKPVVPQEITEAENPAYISLVTQSKAAEIDISAFRNQQAAIQQKLQMYRQRLEDAPKVEQEYLALMRDYQNAHTKHMEVMNKILEARIAEGMEEHQKGEKFTLIDPASYPEKPVSPNRLLIFLAGIFCSLGAGVGGVALVEHLDHSVHNSGELARLTGLPILGSIIRIRTREDVMQARRKRRLIWIVSCGSLIMGLILFHFLYMDLWVLAARLLRLADKYT
jgi:succinoglycan biosynthesis transport protein ExoP